MLDQYQDILPVCSFGRAENIFYHSKYSLCPEDLSSAQVLNLARGREKPVFPSHLLDRPDWESLLREIPQCCSSPRLLCAPGREWSDLESRLLSASQAGWGLDILIDRPLDRLHIADDIWRLPQRRWIVCPLHFHDTLEILRSFPEAERALVRLCFFEPRQEKSLLCSADEVMLWRQRLRETEDLRGRFPLLVLLSSLQTQKSFFQDPSFEIYQENFVDLGELTTFRRLSHQGITLFPRLLGFMVTGLRSRVLLWMSRDYWRRWPENTRFFFRKESVRLRHWALHCFYFFRNESVHVRHRALHCFYFFFNNAPRITYHRLRLFWRIPIFFQYCRWRLLTARNFMVLRFRAGWVFTRYRAIPLIFWPLYKIYWMGEYQFEKRIRPLLKRD